MRGRKSTGSQAKVREEPNFERVCSRLNSVRLWTSIRPSHLTDIYGEDDSISIMTVRDQALKYNSMRQGSREYIADFKTNLDK